MNIPFLTGLLAYVLGRAARKKLPDAAQHGSEEIEIGATGTELRYWQTKEAVRQGERSLTLEASTLSATLAQATTMLGWIVTGVTASAVIAVSPSHPEWRLPAVIVLFGLVLAAILCIYVVFPLRAAQIQGFDAPQILEYPWANELQILDSMAQGLFKAIQSNRKRIVRCQRILAIAWIVFTVTPLASFLFLEFKAHR